MANHEINPEFNKDLRKLETTDLVHADTFNPLFGQLLNNDVFLKQVQEKIQAILDKKANKEDIPTNLTSTVLTLGKYKISYNSTSNSLDIEVVV